MANVIPRGDPVLNEVYATLTSTQKISFAFAVAYLLEMGPLTVEQADTCRSIMYHAIEENSNRES